MKGKRCVGAGIGNHEVVAGHTTAGELRRLVEKLMLEIWGTVTVILKTCPMFDNGCIMSYTTIRSMLLGERMVTRNRVNWLLTMFGLILAWTTPSTAQTQPIGNCFNQAASETYTVFNNYWFQQVGRPSNQSQAVSDPSGFYFLEVKAAQPQYFRFYVGWDKSLVMVSEFETRNIGYCQFNTPFIPPQNRFQYQPPSYAAWAVRDVDGLARVPSDFADLNTRYVKPLIASYENAQSCRSASNGERKKFGECMLTKMLGKKELSLYNCSKKEKQDKNKLALCAISALGGENEQRAAQQIAACYSQHGDRWQQYPLCMAGQQLDENTAKLLSCVKEGATEGSVSILGTAACYGGDRLGLNPELQIALQCAVSTGGEPMAFAGCAGGQLTLRELNKCLESGIGGEGCFGPNNEIVKGLSAIGLEIEDLYGPGNRIVTLWNNGVNDLSNGPGPNNDGVRLITEAANLLANSPAAAGGKIVQSLDGAVAGFTDSFGF